VAEARDLRARAALLGHAPLLAQALVEEGAATLAEGRQDKAAEVLWLAADAAAAARDDRLAAEAWVLLVHAFERQSKYQRALDLATVAKAAISRIGNPPLLSARLSQALGWAAMDLGRTEAARDHFRAAILALAGETVTAERSRALYGLGIALRDLGEYAESVARLDEAYAIAADVYGTGHPHTTMVKAYRARALASDGRWGDAETQFLAVVAHNRRFLDASHPKVGYPHLGLAELYLRMGRWNDAERHLAVADGIWQKVYQPTHHEFGVVTVYRGFVLAGKGKHGAAIEMLKKGLEMLEPSLGKTNARLAAAHRAMAESLLALGQVREAQDHVERGLAIYAAGGEEGERGRLFLTLGQVLFRRGAGKAACEAARDAVLRLRAGGAGFVPERQAAEALLRRHRRCAKGA